MLIRLANALNRHILHFTQNLNLIQFVVVGLWVDLDGDGDGDGDGDVDDFEGKARVHYPLCIGMALRKGIYIGSAWYEGST